MIFSKWNAREWHASLEVWWHIHSRLFSEPWNTEPVWTKGLERQDPLMPPARHSCPHVCSPTSKNITWFLSERRFAGVNPKSWSSFKPGFSFFLCLRNKSAVITPIWNVCERKKGQKHCVIFCYFWFLRSFWSLQILCNHHVSWNIFSVIPNCLAFVVNSWG